MEKPFPYLYFKPIKISRQAARKDTKNNNQKTTKKQVMPQPMEGKRKEIRTSKNVKIILATDGQRKGWKKEAVGT